MTTTAVDTSNLTISAAELRAAIDRGDDVVVLDVRNQGAVDDLRREYAAGHLPGARFVHLGTHLAGARTSGSGNNPLPSHDQVQSLVRDLGINVASTVVVYSTRPAFATRAWWVLRWAGLTDVRYLDGGVAAWQAAGGKLSSEEPIVTPGDAAILAVGSLPSIETEDIEAVVADGLLIDARPAEAYSGEKAQEGHGDGGHIPGAVSRPNGANLDADGLLKSDEELRKIYADALAIAAEGRPVAVYCGGGVGATLGHLALTKIGLVPTLYAGSFSAWSSDQARPIVLGTEPNA